MLIPHHILRSPQIISAFNNINLAPFSKAFKFQWSFLNRSVPSMEFTLYLLDTDPCFILSEKNLGE